MSDKDRLTVNISPETRDALERYRKRKGLTLTEAVRHAAARLDFTEKVEERGAAVCIREPGAETYTEVRFIS